MLLLSSIFLFSVVCAYRCYFLMLFCSLCYMYLLVSQTFFCYFVVNLLASSFLFERSRLVIFVEGKGVSVSRWCLLTLNVYLMLSIFWISDLICYVISQLWFISWFSFCLSLLRSCWCSIVSITRYSIYSIYETTTKSIIKTCLALYFWQTKY